MQAPFALATETLRNTRLCFGNRGVPSIDTVDRESIIIKLSGAVAPRVRAYCCGGDLSQDRGGVNCESGM